MTRHKHAHTGLVTPQLPQLLLTAVLRLFAMLVSSVVSTFQMKQLRLKCDWHTPDDEAALPRMKTDTFKELEAAQHRSPTALILSSARSARPSKDEGVLAAMDRTSPSPAVSLAPQAIHLPLLRRWRTRLRGTSSIAAGGGGGSPRLCGETEGEATRAPPTPNKNAAA